MPTRAKMTRLVTPAAASLTLSRKRRMPRSGRGKVPLRWDGTDPRHSDRSCFPELDEKTGKTLRQLFGATSHESSTSLSSVGGSQETSSGIRQRTLT
uniref:Adipose regulatory protein n=1 Tax=Rhipicephalus appendiculatus TaxID=34631 RepID=A0A131YCE5_RHIAP